MALKGPTWDRSGARKKTKGVSQEGSRRNIPLHHSDVRSVVIRAQQSYERILVVKGGKRNPRKETPVGGGGELCATKVVHTRNQGKGWEPSSRRVGTMAFLFKSKRSPAEAVQKLQSGFDELEAGNERVRTEDTNGDVEPKR